MIYMLYVLFVENSSARLNLIWRIQQHTIIAASVNTIFFKSFFIIKYGFWLFLCFERVTFFLYDIIRLLVWIERSKTCRMETFNWEFFTWISFFLYRNICTALRKKRYGWTDIFWILWCDVVYATQVSAKKLRMYSIPVQHIIVFD